MNVTGPIRRDASAAPHASAIVRHRGDVSYRQLDRLLDAPALRVIDLGFQPADIARLAFPDVTGSGSAFRFFVLALGIARAGDSTKLAEASDEPFVACFTDTAGAAAGTRRSIVVDESWFDAPPDTVEIDAVASHADVAAIGRIAVTSGTAGTSKQVALSHDVMVRRIEGRGAVDVHPAQPVVVVHIGPRSNVGFRIVLRALNAGATIAMARSPGDFLRAIAPQGVDCVVLAPAGQTGGA